MSVWLKPERAMPDDGVIVEIYRRGDTGHAMQLGGKWWVERSHGGPYLMGEPSVPDRWRPIKRSFRQKSESSPKPRSASAGARVRHHHARRKGAHSGHPASKTSRKKVRSAPTKAGLTRSRKPGVKRSRL